MKTKTKTYVLLVLVLGVWGAIAYKITSVVNPTQISQPISYDVTFNPQIKVEADTFSIKQVNRDPFLGTLLVKKKSKNIIRTPVKKELVWLPVLYHGNISKQNSKVNVFVVSISGYQYLMKIGQTINDIKLLSGNSKQVKLSYKGERKTIVKT